MGGGACSFSESSGQSRTPSESTLTRFGRAAASLGAAGAVALAGAAIDTTGFPSGAGWLGWRGLRVARASFRLKGEPLACSR